jgi:Concanavalin A-like lectin/glucanases superfamily
VATANFAGEPPRDGRLAVRIRHLYGAHPLPDRANVAAVGVAVSLVVATSVTQFIDYRLFDLRLKALDSNTHVSIFGAVSLLANAIVVALAIAFAVRARRRQTLVLAAALTAMLTLRVTYPSHLLLVSLPLTGTALAILWRQGEPSAGDALWPIRAGCALLVVSFAIHAWELKPLALLPPDFPGGLAGGKPVGGAIISGGHRETSGNGHLATGTWTHLALTYDGSTLRFYVNGEPLSTAAKTGDITTSTNPLTIGSDPFSGQFFNGLLDEIRVYNTALTTSQIQDDMTRPIVGIPDTRSPGTAVRPLAASSPTPVAAFGFDEEAGTAVRDASGSGNSGKVAHTTWTAAGKYGGALSFDGISSRVTVPDSASLHLTRAMTLEAWVNPTTTSNTWRDVIEKGNDNYYLTAASPVRSWASQVRPLIKHDAELAAWIMIAAGLLTLRTSNSRRRESEASQPRLPSMTR